MKSPVSLSALVKCANGVMCELSNVSAYFFMCTQISHRLPCRLLDGHKHMDTLINLLNVCVCLCVCACVVGWMMAVG